MAVNLAPVSDRRTPVDPSPADSRAARTTREILTMLFGPAPERDFAVQLWDGSIELPPGESRFTIILKHPGALRRMFIPPTELNLAESFLRDDYDIEGDLFHATTLADPIAERIATVAAKTKLMRLVLSLPSNTGKNIQLPETVAAWRRLPHYIWRHTKERDAKAVSFGYDTSNEFYEYWLDGNMQYSCAYFRRDSDDLEQAQVDKLDLICRKLRLKPGERHLDVGCGWGGLLRHAVKHYGVIGYGVSLSKEQVAYANAWFEREGIADRCVVELRDYRDIDPSRRFDKISVIGMVEHVGVANLASIYSDMYRLLEPGGLFLNHLITTILEPPARPGDRGTGKVLRQHNEFIQKYIFPDAEMATIGEVVFNTERVGFEVRDVESLREHYGLTFRHWSKRFEAHRDEIVALMGEPAYRAFRIYLAAFPARFEQRWCSLNQVLLSKNPPGGITGLWSRDDIYRDAAEVTRR